MDWWHTQISSPYYFLVLGTIFLVAAVISTCAGKTFGRAGGSASRAREPRQFWWSVALYYIGGVCFIGYFLYQVHERIR